MIVPSKSCLDIGPSIYRQWFPPEYEVTRFDADPQAEPDMVGDADHLPYEDASFDLVYCSHLLEHFTRGMAPGLLCEWIRVVKPEGTLFVAVPNLAWAALQITHGICNDVVLDCVYGRHETPFDVHHTGYTPETWESLLTSYTHETRYWRNSILTWITKQP